jgi:hypothetical protein
MWQRAIYYEFTNELLTLHERLQLLANEGR